MTHLVCDDLTSIVQSFVNQLASSAIARSHYAMVDFGRGNKVIGGHQFQGEIKPTSSAGSAKDLIDITPMHQKSPDSNKLYRADGVEGPQEME